MKRSELVKILEEQFILRGMLGEHMKSLAAHQIVEVLEKAGLILDRETSTLVDNDKDDKNYCGAV